MSQVLRLPPGWHADLMIAAPKATQAVFAALGDFYTWKLGEKVYGYGSSEAWAAVCSCTNINGHFPQNILEHRLMRV